jgi:Ca2+-binding EF-hand superfamily protein
MARITMAVGFVVAVLCAVSAAAQDRESTRISDMDRNRDGVITRDEWRGSERDFELRDWNRDGLLSGDELRGATGGDAGRNPQTGPEFADWTASGFASLDRNRDGRITRDEWPSDRQTFERADHNRDGAISRAEFLNEDPSSLDRVVNRDPRSRNEPPADLFTSVDKNHDGVITRDEWQWSRRSFNQRDRDRDGRLTPAEFGEVAAPNASQAYQAGYQRGLAEGRQAGREDGQRNTWDLEGQRELETSDSGYNPTVGSRADYQAGYREAFRRAYAEGFGQR